MSDKPKEVETVTFKVDKSKLKIVAETQPLENRGIIPELPAADSELPHCYVCPLIFATS